MPAPNQVPLPLPSWLRARLQPWSVVAASLDEGGAVHLRVRSPRAELPLLLAHVEGRLRVEVSDARVPARAAATFVRALTTRLAPERRLQPWLRALERLASRAGGEAGEDPLALWRAWPTRPPKPHLQIPALPELELAGLSRAARAALCLYTFAREQLLAGLCAWEGLGALPEHASFVELQLEFCARAVLGQRERALELVGRAEALAAGSAQAWTALARAYEELGEREASLRAHAQVIELRGELWDHLRMARTRGGFADDLALEPASLPSDDARLSFARAAAKILRAAGRYDELLGRLQASLRALSGPVPADLLCLCARLHLWRGECEQARQWLAMLVPAQRDSVLVLELEAIIAVLEGEAGVALAKIEAAQAKGETSHELLLWRAEALLLGDELEAALASVDAHILRENSLAAYLLKLHVLARSENIERLEGSIESPTFLDGLLSDVLPSLCEAEELEAACAQPRRFAALTRSILAAMGGNRGPQPTWCRAASSPVPLVRVPLRISGRDASVEVLIGIRHTPPEELLARFEPVAEAYPRSPHPFTYRGELLIWLGRYDEALAVFAAGDERAPTRWSYVGRAATYELLGITQEAESWTRRGIERFGELESATTNVYRGERLRIHGQLEAAQRDLETALRAKPRRIGARMNLALLHHTRGELQAWAEQVERLRADAPAFLFEAGVREGIAIEPADLLRSLELMVGNRSSFLHTMVDAHGTFRVVPAPQQWIAQVRLCLADHRELLAQALVVRWLAREGVQ